MAIIFVLDGPEIDSSGAQFSALIQIIPWADSASCDMGTVFLSRG